MVSARNRLFVLSLSCCVPLLESRSFFVLGLDQSKSRCFARPLPCSSVCPSFSQLHSSKRKCIPVFFQLYSLSCRLSSCGEGECPARLAPGSGSRGKLSPHAVSSLLTGKTLKNRGNCTNMSPSIHPVLISFLNYTTINYLLTSTLSCESNEYKECFFGGNALFIDFRRSAPSYWFMSHSFWAFPGSFHRRSCRLGLPPFDRPLHRFCGCGAGFVAARSFSCSSRAIRSSVLLLSLPLGRLRFLFCVTTDLPGSFHSTDSSSFCGWPAGLSFSEGAASMLRPAASFSPEDFPVECIYFFVGGVLMASEDPAT